jgi:hypothetical protein
MLVCVFIMIGLTLSGVLQNGIRSPVAHVATK